MADHKDLHFKNESNIIEKRSLIGIMMTFFTVCMIIVFVLDIFSIKYGLEWCDSNGITKHQLEVRTVLSMRLLIAILNLLCYLFTWANQKVYDLYLFTSPSVMLTWIINISAFFFCYNWIKTITTEDIPETDFDD